MSDELLEALQQQQLQIEMLRETPGVVQAAPSPLEEQRADALFSEPHPLTAMLAMQLGMTAVSLMIDNHRVMPEAKPRVASGKNSLDEADPDAR